MSPFLSAVFSILLAQSAPAWSVTLDPATSGASNVRWTVSLSARYCGGYQIGDGVYIQPEAPLALPDQVPSQDVLFAGNAADTSLQNGVLRVSQSPEVVRSQICMQGSRPFTIELLPALGMSNPEAGTYTLDVWTGADPTPQQLPVGIQDP